MKFSSYFVQLNHSEPNFTGNLSIGGKIAHANFVKIADELYIAHLKNQQEFTLFQQIEFKNSPNTITVMLPMLSKYNKRKLKRTSDIIQNLADTPKNEILLKLINTEKLLKITKLFHFLSLNRTEITDFLIEKEINKELKLIEYNSLYAISYSHYEKCKNELKTILDKYYENRINNIPLSSIETKIKIPHTSIFFKYLLNILNQENEFKLLRDKIVFQKLALTDKEKTGITHIEKIITTNRFIVFTIEDIIKASGLHYKDVNNTIWLMLNDEVLVQLNEQYFINKDDLNKVINRLKKYKRNQGDEIDINAFRELSSFTRKHIIPVLEYLDTQLITSRIGNNRKILLVV